MKVNKKIALIASVLILQTLIFIICACFKVYIHMDEAFSFGLSSYDRVEFQETDGFYENWHEGEFFESYLCLDGDEKDTWAPVYENQKNDVHPPLFYLLLRCAMVFTQGHYSIWSGVILNIIIYSFVSVFIYLIGLRLLAGLERVQEKSAILALISALTVSSISNVMYIRMYALSTLFAVMTVYFHIRLRESDNDPKFFIPIALVALLGSLTHYYYLFFLFAIALFKCYLFLKDKRFGRMLGYIGALALAGVASIAIFPHSIEHMFFGYQGVGFISRLGDPFGCIIVFFQYLWILMQCGFHYLLPLIVFDIIRRIKQVKSISLPIETKIHHLALIIPSVFYFLLTSIASPWVELRYAVSVIPIIFVVVISFSYRVIRQKYDERKSNLIALILAGVLLITAPLCGHTPESLFRSRANAVEYIEEHQNLPTVYFLNLESNRFLDDILLFSMVDEAYIAKEMPFTAEKIEAILDGKDLSNGVTVFINEHQDHDALLALISETLGLHTYEHVAHLNACDVYYLS